MKDKLKTIPAQKPQAISSPGATMAMILIGAGYILTSFSQMTALMNYEHYRYLFQQYTESSIQFRFLASWLARIIGLSIGIGLLCRKEVFRKAALVFATGTMVVAYWKHPYEGFLKHIHFLNERMNATGKSFLSPDSAVQIFKEIGFPDFTVVDFTKICVASIVAWEIFCALLVIIILTRPRVKIIFR